ncbi:MAG: hypothetical protein ACR2LN_08150 [Candidatus Levyibacteriota bacterium]
MKKIAIGIVLILISNHFATGLSFAQVHIVRANLIPKADQTKETPTPAPTNAVPTSTPMPTPVSTITPTVPAATPHIVQPKATAAPIQSTQKDDNQPTPTPDIVSPLASYTVTPTPAPKPIAATKNKKNPPQPVSQLITAPFELAVNMLPKNYYAEQGLKPRTTTMLLLLSLLCMVGGSIFLAWPYLIRAKNRIFAASQKEKRIIYLHLPSKKGLAKA